ncbi:MAG: hypothetical protein ACTSUE_01600 [Promethearchaeota archaeon]
MDFLGIMHVSHACWGIVVEFPNALWIMLVDGGGGKPVCISGI